MKRLMALLLIGVLLVPVLCGCTQKQYTVLELGSEEAKAFYTYKNKEDYTAPEKMTVKVNGKEYSGTFDMKYSSGNDVYFCYVGENYQFRVSAINGKLLRFSQERLPETTVEIGETQARRIADAIADDYINISDYEFTYNKTMNRFTYTKYISGYKTSEKLEIYLTKDGRVESIDLKDIGVFDRIESVNIDQRSLDKSLDRKLDELAKRDVPKDTKNLGIEKSIYLQHLIMLENGQIAYYGEHIISANSSWHDHYFLAVIVEHQEKATPVVEFN